MTNRHHVEFGHFGFPSLCRSLCRSGVTESFSSQAHCRCPYIRDSVASTLSKSSFAKEHSPSRRTAFGTAKSR